jgi:hypothetical protein
LTVPKKIIAMDGFTRDDFAPYESKSVPLRLKPSSAAILRHG